VVAVVFQIHLRRTCTARNAHRLTGDVQVRAGSAARGHACTPTNRNEANKSGRWATSAPDRATSRPHICMHRLENSFEQEKNSILLEELLAPGAGLELIRAVAVILRSAGRDWNTPPKSHAVSEAITKCIAVLNVPSDEHVMNEPAEKIFPNRNEKGSADQLAWLAVLNIGEGMTGTVAHRTR